MNSFETFPGFYVTVHTFWGEKNLTFANSVIFFKWYINSVPVFSAVEGLICIPTEADVRITLSNVWYTL